jgi:hypothetical protein
MQVEYYAPPGLLGHLHYVTDVRSALAYDGYTTGETLMALNRQLFGTRVEDYDAFVSTYPHFLLCVNLTQPTWLLKRLLNDGSTLALRARDGLDMLYEVSIRNDASRNPPQN